TTAQEAIVEVYHNALFSGHYGRSYTVKRIKENGFTWRTLKETVDKVIDSCLICQKTTPKPDPSIMGTLVQKAPFDQLSVDLFGPIDPDAQLGYKYLTVFVDNFSRFVELVPSESTTVLEAKQALLQVIGRHGSPKTIRTDGGSQFTSSMWRELMTTLGIEHIAPFCGWMLKTDWVKLVPIIMGTINSRVSERTGRSPMEILYGQKRKPHKLFKESSGATPEIWEKILSYREDVRDDVESEVRTSDEKVVSQREQSQTDFIPFKPGEKVLLSRRKPGKKTDTINLGPFVVLEKTSSFYYRVESVNGGKKQKVH
ncbi:uncharacterized protein LOC121377136, partial [Aduncisulcus paluster]